jgi:hypothetical protein
MRATLSFLVLLFLAACGSDPDPGPLAPPSPHPRQGGGFAEDADHTYTFSQVFVRNYGDSDVTIDEVALVDADRGIELVETLAAALPSAPNRFGGADRFPPPYPLDMSEAEGFVVSPTTSGSDGPGVLLILGLRASEDGIHSFRSVAIDDHVGDETFRYVFPYALATCSPQDHDLQHPEECQQQPPTTT